MKISAHIDRIKSRLPILIKLGVGAAAGSKTEDLAGLAGRTARYSDVQQSIVGIETEPKGSVGR